MNASLAWLGELLGTTLDAAATRDRLAMLGAPVDALVPLHHDLEGVVIGLVLEAGKHPNADRLSLCKVDAGLAEPANVVCGAPNVRAGAKYPFAPVGSTLPGGFTLARRKIRGEYSEGMLCSAKELGLGEDAAGILELETDAAPGTRFLDAVPVADTRLDVDVTPNRPDLLSHLGLARELGAALRLPLRLTAVPGAPATGVRAARATGHVGGTAGVPVQIEDTEGCPRYGAAVIRGVAVGPSPAWLQRRLRALGQRPISNVVDATNWLMFESGQPLHAFDLARLAGPGIVVRHARPGETIVTLDGQTRTLHPSICVIADADKATALAGIMGGAGSEVTAGTTDILLECAYFDPRRTRAARRRLGMSTEASYRFERGVDHGATAQVLARAVEVLLAVAGGTLDGTPVDVYPTPIAPLTIFLRDARVGHVLGVDIARADIERSLVALGCVVGPREDRLAVQVPSWRPDLTREIDLIEEVARMVGYDRLPDEMRGFRPGVVPDAPEERAADRLRDTLTAHGLHEAVTLSLGPRVDGAAAVVNPLSQEEVCLRTNLLDGLVRRIEHNWRMMQRDVRLFEIGHIFEAREDDLPAEQVRVAAVLSGAQRPPHWSEAAPPDADLFDLRAVLEGVAGLACPGARVEAGADGFVVHDAEGAVIGRASEVRADRPAWAAPVVGFEMEVRAGSAPAVRVTPLPHSPAAERDVALVLPDGLAAAAVEAVLRQAAGPLLERLWPFDEYRGRPLADGTRSVAWRLVFREEGRTLVDQEVDAVLSRALQQVEDRYDVRRREA